MIKALLWAEAYKLMKQSRTWYAIAAVFVLELIVLISAYYRGAAVIDILLNNLKESFYFEGDLLNGNLLIYLILNSLWFNFPLILMLVISGMITDEYKDGTLQTVMLQPVQKKWFILSKYIVATVFTVLMVLVLALSAFLFSYLIFGKSDLIVFIGKLNFFNAVEAETRLILAFLNGCISMIFFSLASLTFGVIFRDTLKTWIVSVLFLIVSNLLLKFDFKWELINKLFYAKLNDTWQYFFQYEIPWNIILRNNLLLVGYIVGFSAIGVVIFNKKDIG